MTNRRRLTELELEALIERLESLDAATGEAYDYPVEDLVANLRNAKSNKGNEVGATLWQLKLGGRCAAFLVPRCWF